MPHNWDEIKSKKEEGAKSDSAAEAEKAKKVAKDEADKKKALEDTIKLQTEEIETLKKQIGDLNKSNASPPKE